MKLNSIYRVGQIVSFKEVSRKKGRKGGPILEVLPAYRLKDDIKQLTTIKELSDGEQYDWAYRIRTIQSNGYYSEDITMSEGMLRLSSEENIIRSYNPY